MDGAERKMLCDVLRNAKLAPIILHGRKMMGTAPASCLNLPKHFGSLYLESVFFPHGQKPASAVSVFKQAILRYPLSTAMDGGQIDQKRCFTKTYFCETRKVICSMDVANYRNIAAVWNHCHPCRRIGLCVHVQANA